MSLRFSTDGSQITFSQDVQCCIPLCESKNHRDQLIPFYTFPKDAELCKEWLDVIQFKDETFKSVDTLYTTHVVCAKHFKTHKGGMKLCIVEDSSQENTNSVKTLNSSNTSNSIQTYGDDWIESLIRDYGVVIIHNKNIYCRVCACTKVKTISIFNKCNSQLNLENLINTLLPINVTPNDSKSLNICLECLLKLQQFLKLYKCCNYNDSFFDSSTKSKNNKSNIANIKISNDIEVITLSDSENENNNDTLSNSCKKNQTFIPNDNIKKENHKLKIKLMISTKINDSKIYESIDIHNVNKPFTSTNNIIDVEFEVKYAICHGKEWIQEINIDKSKLKYSQETIDQIIKVISCTMKKQSTTYNSNVAPSTLLPLCLDKDVISQNKKQIQTESIINDETKLVVDKVINKDTVILKKIVRRKKSWLCEKCDLKLDDRQSLIKHHKFYHPKPCRFCGEHVIPRDRLITHEKEHYNFPDGYICHICGLRFKANKSLNFHYRKHQNHDQFSCIACNLQFNSGFGLRRHIRRQHKELLIETKSENIKNKQQKCPDCELWLSSSLALRVHMKTHLPIEERIKSCLDCKKTFVNTRRFNMHTETHGPCNIKCPECPRLFPNQRHLDYHLYYHKMAEPMYCDICQSHFKNRATLKMHIIRVHQGVQYIQKSFTCIFYNAAFIKKDVLKIHIDLHTIEEKAQAFVGD